MMSERELDREAAKKGWIKLLLILLFIAVLALCKRYLIDFADVSGKSMSPTFSGADISFSYCSTSSTGQTQSSSPEMKYTGTS